MAYCQFCGAQINDEAVVCTYCGRQVKELQSASSASPYINHANPDYIPVEATGWSWGAFWLDWIWGIGNKTWIMLLALIFPFIMSIIGGINGKKWAWQNGDWRSVEHYVKTQRTWSTVGWVIFLVGIVLAFLIFGIGIAASA